MARKMSEAVEGRPAGRGRSRNKSAAIVAAARRRFLTHGYQGVSVDTIAADAEVSKRTIYDHFGDKERLFGAVVAAVSATVLESLRQAINDELPDGCDPSTALLTFARRVATETFPSSDYAIYRQLLAAAGPAQPQVLQELEDPAEMLAERISAFAAAGTVTAPNPRRATDHFIALTFLLALDAIGAQHDQAFIDAILVSGVDAFLRAYPPPRRATSEGSL